MELAPDPSDRFHGQHPSPTRSMTETGSLKHSSGRGGQFWTPITPQRGSHLHAETAGTSLPGASSREKVAKNGWSAGPARVRARRVQIGSARTRFQERAP